MPLAPSHGSPAHDAAETCTFGYVKTLLGHRTMSDARFCRFAQSLVEDHGFPKPFPTMLRNDQITLDVHPRSRWVRSAVDAWVEGWVPPAAAAHIDAKAMEAAAADMDAAATRLRMVGGKDYEGAPA